MGNCCSKGNSGSRDSVEDSASQLQVLVAELMQKLQNSVKDVSQFEEILNYVGQAIDKLRNPNKSIQIPEVISSNMDDAEKALDGFSSVTESILQSHVGDSDFLGELEKVVGHVLGEVGNLHWITAAFSMIALVLKRLDQMQENRQSFLEILESLHQLGLHLVDLLKLLPQESDKFWKASSLVIGGAVLCVSQLNATRLKRFAYVNTSAASTLQLKEQVSLLYQDLSLTIEKENLKRTRRLRSFYKPEDSTDMVGREQTVAEILAVMQPTSKEKCHAVLLHGMGGVGKTTLGNALLAKISTTIKNIVKVHVGENPTSQTICNCQSSIYERLLGEKSPKIDDASDGRRLLQDCLKRCSPPILLYVDNVFSEGDLKELLPRNLILPKDSHLIVTSRYERISQAFASNGIIWRKFHITGLKRSDAEALFERELGGRPEAEEGQEHFNSVLDLCDGWPLALEVVGAHLRASKDELRAWGSTISNLKACKGVSGRDADSVKGILKWSYAEVSPECRSVFVDVCCLMRNETWDTVAALGTGSELDTLKAFSMLKKVEHVSTPPWPVYRVEMHDLFVALGKENESSSKMRRLFYEGGLLPKLLEEYEPEDACDGIEGLILQPKKELLLPAGKLDAMHRTLRILYLASNVRVQGECLQVPPNLQVCNVNTRFPYKGLTGLNDLRVLKIWRSNGINFADQTFPGTLEVLELERLFSLITFHEKAFEQCKHLHRLRITHCKLVELPASIWDACHLRELLLHHVTGLNSLPAGMNRLQSLEKFYCLNCPLGEFPSEIADLKKLRYAFVGGFQNVSRRVDVSQLSLLEHLQLDFAKVNGGLQLHGFGKLHVLRILRLVGSKGLQRIHEDFSQLKVLTELSFIGCKSLTHLPDGVQNLLALADLNLTGCESLEALPDGLGQLSSLDRLLVGGCNSLPEVPRGLGNMKLLTELNLRARNLKQWPGGLSQLTALRSLHLQASESSFVWSDTFTLIHLTTLTLNCEAVTKLPEEFEKVTDLKRLELEPCNVMIDLPSGYANLTSLCELSFYGCESLVRLPEGIVQLAALQVLRVEGCHVLKELPSGFRSLVSLSELRLVGCKSLVRLPEELCQLSSLQSIVMDECEALEALPSHFGNLINLVSVHLSGCRSLQKLPDGWENLVKLRSLWLEGCDNLQLLPDSVCKLKQLQDLGLSGGFDKLPERLGEEMHALCYVNVSGCDKLEDLPQSLMQGRTQATGFGTLSLPSNSKIRQSEVVKQLEAKKVRSISVEQVTLPKVP